MRTQASKNSSNLSDFNNKLGLYKIQIDKELVNLAEQMLSNTAEEYGEYPAKVVEAFNNVLLNGGKRIRGSLAIASYKMFGGKDEEMIIKAAAALEFFNTYILVADDIQDRSDTRRGVPTAHKKLANQHQDDRLKGDAAHYGEALAINSFLIAQHFAANIIVDLGVAPELKLRALNNINNCLIVTAHGQTMDIYSEAAETSNIKDVFNVLEWKTAYYTFINPLQMGAILAGAGQNDLQELGKYGLAAGRAFQITDDIIGTFGKSSETGKSELDDIKEGKRTLLVVKALQECSSADAYFLQSMLGNQHLTKADFEKCKAIIKQSGALDYAKAEAKKSVKQAVDVLDANDWPASGKIFLQDLVSYLLVRKA